ncbi:hypothetical protein D3C72_1724880 [compost metagenome]
MQQRRTAPGHAGQEGNRAHIVPPLARVRGAAHRGMVALVADIEPQAADRQQQHHRAPAEQGRVAHVVPESQRGQRGQQHRGHDRRGRVLVHDGHQLGARLDVELGGRLRQDSGQEPGKEPVGQRFQVWLAWNGRMSGAAGASAEVKPKWAISCRLLRHCAMARRPVAAQKQQHGAGHGRWQRQADPFAL